MLKKYSFYLVSVFMVCFALSIIILRLKLYEPFPLFNDNYSLGYPLRILVSTSLRNGIFPLWDHWTHGGFPISTLLTMQNIFPLVWLLSIFGRYTIQLYSIEILLMHVIGGIGMFFWLRSYVDRKAAMIVSICYPIAFNFLTQSQINFESTGSAMMFPWLALGLRYIMTRQIKGIGITALAFWFMMAEGYLGMNIIAIQFIIFFVISEYLITDCAGCYISKNGIKQILMRGYYLSVSLLLTVMIMSIPIVETFVHFQGRFITLRQDNFDPFAGSGRIFSIFTLFFPNYVSAYTSDQFFASTAIMYFGSLLMLFFLYACLFEKRRRLSLLLLLFFILSFFAILSSKYLPGRIMNSWLPFYKFIRWHAWNVTIPIFFGSTLSAVGIASFLVDKTVKKKIFTVTIFILLAAICAYKQSGSIYISPFRYLFYPQVTIWAIFIVCIYFYNKLHKNIPSSLVCILLLIEIFLVSKDIDFFGNNLYYRGGDNETMKKRELLKTTAFPIPLNKRSDIDEHVNTQYYTKEPSLYGYHPIIYPAIQSVIKIAEYPAIMSNIIYPISPEGQIIDIEKNPIQIQYVKFNPNSISFLLTTSMKNSHYIWSSPYTKNWTLSVNGIPIKTYSNRWDLTEFELSKGTWSVILSYNPWYLLPCIISSLLGMMISIRLAINRKK